MRIKIHRFWHWCAHYTLRFGESISYMQGWMTYEEYQEEGKRHDY